MYKAEVIFLIGEIVQDESRGGWSSDPQATLCLQLRALYLEMHSGVFMSVDAFHQIA